MCIYYTALIVLGAVTEKQTNKAAGKEKTIALADQTELRFNHMVIIFQSCR